MNFLHIVLVIADFQAVFLNFLIFENIYDNEAKAEGNHFTHASNVTVAALITNDGKCNIRVGYKSTSNLHCKAL